MCWERNSYLMWAWTITISLRKLSSVGTWPIDLSKPSLVEPLRMIEITTVRSVSTWLEPWFVVSSGKSSEESSMICKSTFRKISTIREEISLNDSKSLRIISRLTRSREDLRQPYLQVTGVKTKSRGFLKLESLKLSTDWLLHPFFLIWEESPHLLTKKVSKQSQDSFTTLIGVWSALPRLLREDLVVLSRTSL